MKDSISRWSLHYEGWAAEHNISCLPRGNRSRGKGLSLLSPCRGGAPPFSPALPSYSVSLLFLLFAPAVTKPHSGRFSSAFRPFCSANPAAGSRNMHMHKRVGHVPYTLPSYCVQSALDQQRIQLSWCYSLSQFYVTPTSIFCAASVTGGCFLCQ